ncbi:MAG: sigma-70 family RNA polymerase sigma factor [Oscillospiraceae bacterium]|nr:sigma-70 family RNA polymerase sigma factor [Oscillospiraceae bacterium]
MQDTGILELYRQRDERAIAETDAAYGAYCRSIAENILHSYEDTEECVSDAYLRAWNTIPPARPKSLKLFLAKITRNLAFDAYKRKNAEKRGGGETPLILEELAECISGGSTEEDVFGRALEHTVNVFVKKLPKREQSIFVRRYFYAEPISAIAKRYGISEGGIKSSLMRTRQKLKNHLLKEGFLI